MDFFDFIPIVPPSGPGRRDRPRNEDAAAGIAIWGLPGIYMMLLAYTELYKQTQLSLVVLPLAFAALAAMLRRPLRVPTAWAVLCTLGCAGMSMLMAVGMLMLDVMIFPF